MTLPFFLLLALMLRLSGFAASDLWYDEWLSWYRASQPLQEYFMDNYEYTGANLWELLLRLFTWGPPWLVRVPALACALLSLWLSWRIMLLLDFTPAQRTASALILAAMPGLLWMAQDARFYAALGLLSMGALWAALSGRAGWLGACVVISLYIHPTGPAYTLPAVLIALLSRRLAIYQVVITLLVSFSLWIPRLLQVLFMAKSYGEFWASALTLNQFVYEYGQSITVNTLWTWGGQAAFLFFGALLLIGLLNIRKSPTYFWLWLNLAGPVFMLIVVSLVYKNVITYRTLQPAALGLALLAGRALIPSGMISWKWIPATLGLALLVGMLLHWDPSVRSGGLAQIAAHIRHEWKPGDTLVYVTGTAAPFDLYLSDLAHCQLDWPNHDLNIEPPMMRRAVRCRLEDIHGRAWLVWPHSPLISASLVDYLERKTNGLTSVTRSTEAWQMSPLEIFILEGAASPITKSDAFERTHKNSDRIP